MLLPKVPHINMCRKEPQTEENVLLQLHRQRLYYSLLLPILPDSQTWWQDPCGPAPREAEAKTAGAQVLEASMAIQGGSLQNRQADKPTTNMFLGIFLLPGRRWESLGREKNVQTTQISFVKYFETVLRIAAQILQSNKRRTQYFLSFLSEGQKTSYLWEDMGSELRLKMQ